jgi:hypothetical protein
MINLKKPPFSDVYPLHYNKNRMTQQQKNIDKMAAKIELCRRELLHYFSFILNFPVTNHQKIIIDSIQKSNENLIISMPPRAGKTTLISEIYISWLLGNAVLKKSNVNKIGLYTYGQDLSNIISSRIRNIINSNYWKYIFGDRKLATDSIQRFEFERKEENAHSTTINMLDKEVSFTCGSINSTMTGLGFDLVVIDDPIKNLEEARNVTYTEKIYNWFQSVALTRLEKNGRIIIVATRWSDHDLSGRLIDQGWPVINLKAIENNTSYWPEQFPLEKLEDIREAVGPKIWSSLYLGSPTPAEGILFKPDWIQYKKSYNVKQRIISWDTASKISELNDYSVGIQLALDEFDNVIVENIFRGKLEFQDLLEKIKIWGDSDIVYVEDSANGIPIIQSMKTHKRSVIPVKALKSKISRAELTIPYFNAGKIYFNDEYIFSDCINELLTFPDGKNDDCVDSLIQGILALKKNNINAIGAKKELILKASPYDRLF